MSDPQQPLSDEPEQDKLKLKQKSEYANLPPLHTESLMEIFDFSQMDLRTNRNNMATQFQKEKLGADLQDDADAMWLLVTVLLAVSLFLAFVMLSRGIPLSNLVVGAGAVLGPMLLYAFRRQTETRKDADNLRVRSVTGLPLLRYHRFSRGGSYTLEIDDVKIPLTMYQARALSEYAPMLLQVNYSEHSKMLLSAEVIDDSADYDHLQDKSDWADSGEDDKLGGGQRYDEGKR